MTPLNQGPRPRVAPNSEFSAKQSHGNDKQRKKRALFDLNLDSDSDARKAWRSNAEPDAEYDFLTGYNPSDDTGALQKLKFIQAKTGTHFIIYRRTQNNSNTWAVKIWGTPGQVVAAKLQLDSHVIDSNASGKRNRTWSKVERNKGWEYEELRHKKLQRDMKRQKYRQTLSDDEIREKKFAYSVVVPWSEEETHIEDILGQQLEALDEIRMDGLCYITFKRNLDESVFLLLGDKQSKMAKAAARIQTIPARILSHSLESAQFFLFKAVALPFDYSAFKVHQVNYFRPSYVVPDQKLTADEAIAGKGLLLRPSGVHNDEYLDEDFATIPSLNEIQDHGAIWLGSKHLTKVNQQYLHLWVTTALEQLRAYNGYIKMDVHIGTCVFQRYKHERSGNGTYGPSLMEDFLFEANNGLVELDAAVVAHLGEDSGKILLERFFENRAELSFYDQPLAIDWTIEQCLAKCYPRLQAAFVINQGSADNLRLELEYKRSSEDDFIEISRRWLPLRSNGRAPPGFCDINLLDLHNPRASYGLKISRCNILGEIQEAKLNQLCIAFANEVRPNPDVVFDVSANKRLFTFPADAPCTLVNLSYYEQRRSWLFTIGLTGYFVELYTVREVEIKQLNPSRENSTQVPWPREENWGIRVFHERWEGLFNENQELEIGNRAGWEPSEARFFPSEGYLDYIDMEGTEAEVGAGFHELMRVLKLVESTAMAHQEKKTRPQRESNTASTLMTLRQGSDSYVDSVTNVQSLLYGISDIPNVAASTPAPTAVFSEISLPTTEKNFEGDVRMTPITEKEHHQIQIANHMARVASEGVLKSGSTVYTNETVVFVPLNAIPSVQEASNIDLFASSTSQTTTFDNMKKSNTSASRSTKKEPRLRKVSASRGLQEESRNTRGFWTEEDGLKGLVTALPTPIGTSTNEEVQQAEPVSHISEKSWASVVRSGNSSNVRHLKEGNNWSKEFPPLGA